MTILDAVASLINDSLHNGNRYHMILFDMSMTSTIDTYIPGYSTLQGLTEGARENLVCQYINQKYNPPNNSILIRLNEEW
jgi:hypothetical protein